MVCGGQVSGWTGGDGGSVVGVASVAEVLLVLLGGDVGIDGSVLFWGDCGAIEENS